MPCNDNFPEVGQAFYEHVTRCECLSKFLCHSDAEGGRRWNVHRSQVPQQNLYERELRRIDEAQQSGRKCAIDLNGFEPYLWYELRDEIYEECLGADDCDKPVIVEFDVELVAFTLQEILGMARQLRKCLCSLNSTCETKCMGKQLEVQSVTLSGANDTYETQNELALMVGGFTRDFTLSIRPWWWG